MFGGDSYAGCDENVLDPRPDPSATSLVVLKLAGQSRNVKDVDSRNDGLTPGDLIAWGPDPF